MCGTTTNNKVFFAIYNTAYNLTEYIDEDTRVTTYPKEVCKNIEIDINTGHVIILYETTSDNSIFNLEIKTFSLKSIFNCILIGMAPDWEQKFIAQRYSSSCLVSDFLVSASYTSTVAFFDILWIETGEVFSPTTPLTYTDSDGNVQVVSMTSAGESGIYALLKYSNAYKLELLEFSFSTSKVLAFASVASRALPGDVAEDDVAVSFAKYPPCRVFSYYTSNVRDIPGVLLAGHVNTGENSGLLLYGFSRTDANGNLIEYSYNPFAVPVSDSKCGYGVVGTSKCLKCNQYSSYMLASGLSCDTACPLYHYYNSETARCSLCHLTCSQCSGPLQNHCTSCMKSSVYDAILEQCVCTLINCFSKGKCDSGCGSSTSYQFKAIRANAPKYTFDLGKKFSNVFMTTLTPDETTSVYKLSKCSRFAVPNRSAMPNDFFLGLWVYTSAPMDNAVILSGLSDITISIKKSPVDKVKFTLLNGYSTIEQQLTTTWDSTAWKYIAISIKNEYLDYYMTVYTYTVIKSSSIISDSYTKKGSLILKYSAYDPTIYIGCIQPTQTTNNLNGYVRELLYIPRYYNKEEMEIMKSLVFSNKLQMYPYIESYWRCNRLSSSGHFVEEINRYTSAGENTLTGDAQSKSLLSLLKTARNCESRLGVVGSSFDLFFYSKFPGFSFDTTNFAANELQPRLNMNSFATLSGIIQVGDYISFQLEGCSGIELGRTTVTLDITAKIILTKNVVFTKNVRGKFVDSCYCNSVDCVWLGRTYFPLLPIWIYPAFGQSASGSTTPLKFQLQGGDQSYGDKLTLIQMDTNVMGAIKETIVVNENAGNSQIYTAVRGTDKTYSSIMTRQFDSGVYTIAWRPFYLPYITDEKTYAYKNLFNTWTIQAPPKVSFPPLSNTANTYRSNVNYKAEFFYLELTGFGQADGDQVILCKVDCSYKNRNSRIFQRDNSRYPPIWFGYIENNFGVWGINTNTVISQRLYFCWRPAARVAQISPSQDTWVALENAKSPGTKAYISVNSIVNELPEITWTSLSGEGISNGDIPITAPILYEGGALWFILKYQEITNKIESVAKGRIDIAHVTYDKSGQTISVIDTVWTEILKGSDPNGGKISANNANNYTLLNIPFNVMKSGHDYALIIYGGSFKINPSYFLGGTDNVSPKLYYMFRYQEMYFDEPSFNYMAPLKDTEVTITGKNFGTLTIPKTQGTELRKFFGATINLVMNPPCNQEIKTGYIQGTIDDNPQSLIIRNLDFSSCKKQHNLTISLKVVKISAEFTDYSLWSTSKNLKPLLIGSIGCDSSCKTCNGTTALNCLTCNASGPYPYLYNTKCLAKCPSNQKYSYIIFEPGTYVISYYKCTASCKTGYYSDDEQNVCMPCNYECAACTSGKTESCTSCKGAYTSTPSADYLNIFSDCYSFKNMCFINCPTVLRDDFNPSSNVIKSNNYEHICLINEQKLAPVYFNVTIQTLLYDERVDVTRPLYLRALFDDIRNFDSNPEALSPIYHWTAHPQEDMSAGDFTSSDERIFQSYSDENIRQSVTELNTNAFNYKSDSDNVRVVIRAWANGGFNFDITEVFGNKPPELDEFGVKLKFSNESHINKNLSTSDELQTTREINVNIDKIKDGDDYFPIIKYKVLLNPRSMTLANLRANLSTPKSALEILAKLPGDFMILYSNKIVYPNSKGVITLENVYVPPIVDGLQIISSADGVTSDTVTCDLILYAEDRHSGVTKTKFSLQIKELYNPEYKNNTLKNLHAEMLAKNNNNSLEWDDALKIAHTLRVIAPEFKSYYMAYTACARDDQCSNEGVCLSSGGWSECGCKSPYTGYTCDWTLEELALEQDLTRMIINFLNITLFLPVDNFETFMATDTDIIDQLANVLIGISKNPETIPEEYVDFIVHAANYMTKIDYIVGGRMESFEKENVYKAIDSIIKYVYFYLKQNIYKFYALGEYREKATKKQLAQFVEMRSEIFGKVKMLKDSLYRFVDATTISQYPKDQPTIMEYDSFEVFLLSDMENKMFTKLGDSLGIQFNSNSEYIKIPSSLLERIRKDVSINEEFKIRIVKWRENPYIFSEYHSEVCTPVFSFSLLNANSTPIALKAKEPLVFLIPVSFLTKNFPTDEVRCMSFNENHKEIARVYKRYKVNVNDLRMTNEEKMVLYPEWNADYYYSKNLVIEKEDFPEELIVYPEYEDIQGISSYGNMLYSSDYSDMIMCAVYTSSEVAGITQRKAANERGSQSIDFYNLYDPFQYVNICAYCCIVVGIMFGISVVITLIMDYVLLPVHNKLMMLYRPEYIEEKPSADFGMSSNEPFSENSQFSDLSDGREESIKLHAETEFPDKKKSRPNLNKGKVKHKKLRITDERPSEQDPKNTLEAAIDKKNSNLEREESKRAQIRANTTRNDITKQGSSKDQTHNGATINTLVMDSQKTNFAEQFVKQHFEEFQTRTKDIFSKEYIQRREARQFCFYNVLIYSNLICNIILRTNTIFRRYERCIILYSYIYLLMLCCSLLMSMEYEILNRPEYLTNDHSLNAYNIWIVFINPIAASLLLYMAAGIYKVEEEKLLDTKTGHRYKELL